MVPQPLPRVCLDLCLDTCYLETPRQLACRTHSHAACPVFHGLPPNASLPGKCRFSAAWQAANHNGNHDKTTASAG